MSRDNGVRPHLLANGARAPGNGEWPHFQETGPLPILTNTRDYVRGWAIDRKWWRERAATIAAMAKRKILIIQGHPDPASTRYCRALATSYADGAREAGHEVRLIDVARIDFPLVRSREEFENTEPPIAIRNAQDWIRWADHLVVVYPLWLGTLPALLKAFFEQTFRYGFALGKGESGFPARLLKGRTAHVIVTMGMPAAVYRMIFGAHGLKSLVSGVLKLSGISPVRTSLIGLVDQPKVKARTGWLERMKQAGREAQ
jgi:putative NADPH-quinone reductase